MMSLTEELNTKYHSILLYIHLRKSLTYLARLLYWLGYHNWYVVCVIALKWFLEFKINVLNFPFEHSLFYISHNQTPYKHLWRICWMLSWAHQVDFHLKYKPLCHPHESVRRKFGVIDVIDCKQLRRSLKP